MGVDLAGLALLFLIAAIVSLVLAFGFLTGTSAFIAKIVFIFFLVLFAWTAVRHIVK
jgi:uncharacterized membrane protein YtjA (UPF0391 family)